MLPPSHARATGQGRRLHRRSVVRVSRRPWTSTKSSDRILVDFGRTSREVEGRCHAERARGSRPAGIPASGGSHLRFAPMPRRTPTPVVAVYRARRTRRILCVFPRYAHSFGTFQHAYELLPGVRAFMPPQGILLVAAYLPREWSVRLVDENVRPVTERDIEWSDVVFVSGMHVQRPCIERLIERVHCHGKVVVVG